MLRLSVSRRVYWAVKYMGKKIPPIYSGRLPLLGALDEFVKDPLTLIFKAHKKVRKSRHSPSACRLLG